MLHDPLPTRRDDLSEGEYFLVQVLKRGPSPAEFEIKAAGILRSKFRSVRRPWLRISEADVAECGCGVRGCEECWGFNAVHGYDSKGRALPVRRVTSRAWR